MAINIPIASGLPEQSLRIELDGAAYNIRVYWNQYDDAIRKVTGDEDGKWYMDLAGDDFTINGISLVGGADLFEPYGYRQLGSLFVADTSGNSQDPVFDGLGDRWLLRYYDTTENEQFLKDIGYL
ncbi:MAG: phage baseplate plug family protein [Aeromonadaceae bacterium]